jgi:hypothetical protein
MTMHLCDIRGEGNQNGSIGGTSRLWMIQDASVKKHLERIGIRKREKRVQSTFCVVFDASLNQWCWWPFCSSC